MAMFEHGDVRIHFEEQGDGFPILLIAPGGMRSTIAAWSAAPWDVIADLATHYRVIIMDQRNAGQSRAPITAQDSWDTYTADQLALMDHLEIDRFHVAGMCIGGPYIIGLIKNAPDRVVSAVMFQPIGLDDNKAAFYAMFDNWADALKPKLPEVPADAWSSFRSNMYDGDFLFNATREEVARVTTPLLVLKGDDLYHPASTSLEIADLAPNATLIEDWKQGPGMASARTQVLEFLSAAGRG
ncbi:MAG: alpha/beta hydrolase [Proteobacteria bacterium]|nr:alpha/beta hydrolase [Pseudomonadota bacterium]